VHPCGGTTEGLFSPSRPTPPFSRACASATPAPCPPLAPHKRRPPPHALIASAASPWLGAPHLQHIHRRLPSAAASHPRSRRSALPPQVCCRWEGWEGYGGSLYAQLAGKWEEGSLRTARGAMSFRGCEDDGGWGDARSACRTKLAPGGRCSVGDPGACRVGSQIQSVYLCGGAV
jgi:hypothetical protein